MAKLVDVCRWPRGGIQVSVPISPKSAKSKENSMVLYILYFIARRTAVQSSEDCSRTLLSAVGIYGTLRRISHGFSASSQHPDVCCICFTSGVMNTSVLTNFQSLDVIYTCAANWRCPFIRPSLSLFAANTRRMSPLRSAALLR